ncbi:MAG: hypothetical protein HDT21_06045 [Ruminococcus sp.]|nr:hypothetical protein [Ruminococcus sp.]
MLKQPKEIRRIYMVSSAAFSTASCVYGWAAPLGAMLGLVVNLTEDSKNDNIKDFSNAVETALERTKRSMSSESKQRILEELCEIEIEPDTLRELIKETESYRKYYCTENDAQEIINVFEMHFREEIAKSPQLSNLYILSTGVVTLDKLKIIVDGLEESNKKLDEIQSEVSGIRKMLEKAKIVCIECLNSIAFILVSMSVFAGFCIFSDYPYDKTLVLIAPFCYGISDFLIFFLNKKMCINKEMRINLLNRNITIPYFSAKYNKIWRIIVSPMISIVLTVSCFWLMILVLNINRDISFFPTYGLIVGNVISIIFKNIWLDA